ncbi:cytochrome P450 2J4-like [Danio aesculapii]|uniref:cytochrome P450 2J4-like n=1 Tax=Danio aesculapii TaxID=1142201 RepID=UPI0024BF40DD|nr:cytochrome P450 2J4-like [Danio aesculapii]
MDLLHFSEWIDLKTILIFTLVFLLLSHYIKNKVPENFPPGAWSLPIIGDLHYITHKKIHLQLEKFAEKYGNVLSIQILGPRIVVLIGYKTVKESYAQGLVASNGHNWKQQRRFALSTLRTFGMGKKNLGPSINVECHFLNEAISSENDSIEEHPSTCAFLGKHLGTAL